MSGQFAPGPVLPAPGLVHSEKRVSVAERGGRRWVRVRGDLGDTTLRTPDPQIAQVWLVRDGADWLVGLDESALTAEIAKRSGSVDDQLDLASVAIRWELGHALFVPSITRCTAVPPSVTIKLEGETPADAIDTAVSNLTPQRCSPDDLLESIVDSYASEVRDADEVGALVSAGWDSRLEVAALHAAMRPHQRLHLLHIYSGQAEMEVAQAVANRLGATITVMTPGPLLHAGLANGPLRRKLCCEATWRPTVPLFTEALASLKASIDGPVYGLVMTELKGRDYELPLPGDVPMSGKLRARAPSGRLSLPGRLDIQSALARQQRVWQQNLGLSQDWDLPARRDFLWWQINFGFTHSHRLRAVRDFALCAPWHKSDIFARFMGLPQESKTGNRFILTALTRLASRLDEIPVIGSSGDGSHLTKAQGGDFAAVTGEPAVLLSAGVRPPDLGIADRGETPNVYVQALGRSGDISLALCRRSAVARELLTASRPYQDHHLVNAIQLSEFIESVGQA